MKNQIKLLTALFVLCTLPISGYAGLWSWFFGQSPEDWLKESANSNLTVRAQAATGKKAQQDAKLLAQIEQRPALQVGVLHGSVNHKAVDKFLTGTVELEVTAKYDASYGLPFDLVERGLRIEKDISATNLVVVIAQPVPLLVAVDTKSIYSCNRSRSGLRTWGVVDKLQNDATKDLTRLATRDAQQQCCGALAFEQTRAVMRDIVLDMIGEISSKKIKRFMSTHLIVIFEGESREPPLQVERVNISG